MKAARSLSLAVVGADYPNRRGPTRHFEIALCRPGEPVQLVPEPKNPADPRAIAVLSMRGVQIGYLTAERAPWIGAMIKAGKPIVAVFQEKGTRGAVIRANLDGVEPELPSPAGPPPESVDWDPGFYPDEPPREDDL